MDWGLTPITLPLLAVLPLFSTALFGLFSASRTPRLIRIIKATRPTFDELEGVPAWVVIRELLCLLLGFAMLCAATAALACSLASLTAHEEAPAGAITSRRGLEESGARGPGPVSVPR